MIATESIKLINKTGSWYPGELKGIGISVTILDVRDSGWGRTDYLVTPVQGNGSKWVSSGSVNLSD